MQNPPLEAQTCFPCPPLPPPLPPPSLHSSLPKIENYVREYSHPLYPSEEYIRLSLHNTHRCQAHLLSDYSGHILSFYKPVESVLQNGRSCGIVALSMASQLINDVDPNSIFMSAYTRGFSKNGELFSAYNVALLAEDLLNCDVKVLSDLCSQKRELLNHICDGWPFLIPYDADKNHSPCLNKGHSAHWAVITGLCFPMPEDLDIAAYSGIKTDNFSDLKIHHVKEGQFIKPYLNDLSVPLNVHVYAHQGKSRHVSAWDFDELLESNLNLYEVTKKFSPDELVLPVDGALSELRNKAVLLKKRAS